MADLMIRRPMWLSRDFGRPFRRLFEDFFEGTGQDLTGLPELWSEARFAPAIDVTENEDAVTLTAEIPGMDSDDLDVTVDNGVLTLKGEKKEETTTEEVNYCRVERRYGHFERRIRLPDCVDAEKIEASYKDGILKLRMPKTDVAKAKTIEIKQG